MRFLSLRFLLAVVFAVFISEYPSYIVNKESKDGGDFVGVGHEVGCFIEVAKKETARTKSERPKEEPKEKGKIKDTEFLPSARLGFNREGGVVWF
jgi:hypothetical protein